jgi:hypothetical protein
VAERVRHRREEDDFIEIDLRHLQEQIDELQKSFGQLRRPSRSKLTMAANDQID